MADNVIKAVFASGRRVKTAPLWRYDHGIRLQPIGLELPENYEMHFSNSETGEAKTVLADASGAVIPAEYLIPGTEVYAWLYLVGDTYGRTKAEIIIPVDAKAKPIDQEPTPEQQSVIEQAIDALNDAVDAIPEEINAALAEAKESGEFDGEDGEDGKDGADGQDGADGKDGNSIWYTTSAILEDGTRLLTPRRNMQGRDGTPGVGDLVIASEPGEGHKPTYLYRIIDDYGPYSVLEAIGSIKGDTGATGADGAPGPQGPAGRDGQDGAQGPAGADGKDGADGAQGPAGADGYSPEVTITQITGGHRVTITDEDHPQGQSFDVMDGQGGGDNVFIAQYGVTTQAELEAAYQAGKALFCDYVPPNTEGIVCRLSFYNREEYDPVRTEKKFWFSGTAVPNDGSIAQYLASCGLEDFDEWQIETLSSPQPRPYGNPSPLGAANPGSMDWYSRHDHVHPMPSASDVGAVAKSQGTAHAGEFLVVGSDGNVTTVAIPAASGVSF